MKQISQSDIRNLMNQLDSLLEERKQEKKKYKKATATA